MKIKILVLNIIIIVSITGCIPQKQIDYMLGSNSQINEYEIKTKIENKIKPGDELLINVSSFDDMNFNYFGRQGNGNTSSSGEALSSISYTVSDSGFIYFPILDKIKLGGLTLFEASSIMEGKLQTFLDQPNVKMKFAYKRVTILGEVAMPGYHLYSDDNISFLEAIGIAGDITIHGDMKKVLIIREGKDKINKYTLDLTNQDILASDLYYIKPNDVIYIPPRRSLKWDITTQQVSLTLSLLTTTILIFNFIEGY